LSAVAVLTFALGIGATTAVLGVVEATLFTPPPFRDPSRLVVVWPHLPEFGNPRTPLSGPELQDLRTRTTSFEGISALWTNQIVLTDRASPSSCDRLRHARLLLTARRAGRRRPDLLGEGGRPKAPPALLLSFSLWQRRFGGDPDVVGRTLSVNDGRRASSACARRFPAAADVGLGHPRRARGLPVFPWDVTQGPRGQKLLRVVARLKPSVRLADAAHEVARGRAAGVRARPAPAANGTSTREPRGRDDAGGARAALCGDRGRLAAAGGVRGERAGGAGRARRRAQARDRHAHRARRRARAHPPAGVGRGADAGAPRRGARVGVGHALLRGLVAVQPVALRRLAEVSIDWPVLAVASGSPRCGAVCSRWRRSEPIDGAT
jgi:hypothetical protein